MLERNHNIVHKDGGLYNIGMKRLISVENYDDTFVISEGVEYIAECAFWKCERLKHVVIPNSVVDIGTSDFAGCEARLDRVSLTYLWQSEETLMINSLDHKSFPSMTN